MKKEQEGNKIIISLVFIFSILIISFVSAQEFTLSSDSPKSSVSVGGESYSLELVSATDNSATFRVVDNQGRSEMKEVAESGIMTINNVKIKVVEADETNLKLSVSIVVYGASEELEIKEVTPDEETGVIEVPKNEEKKEIIVCNGCLLEDKCYSFGYRKNEKFCSENKEFIVQLEAGAVCENNFECGSNVCAARECVSESLIKKIINWFKRAFGLDRKAIPRR